MLLLKQGTEMKRRTSIGALRHLTVCASVIGLALALGLDGSGAAQRGEPGEGTRGQGAAAQVSPAVEALTGSAPRDFACFARDHARLFAPAAAAARR